jgi:hypothetical protein
MSLRRASMRPHFDVRLSGDGRSLFAALKSRLSAPDAPFVGVVLSTHAYLRVPRHERSLLSPNLNLELVKEVEGTVLRARFTPHPSVWMGFMAVFFTLGLIGVGGLMYGFAQMTVDETPWSMLAAPVCLGLIAFVYGAAFVAQGLVQEEMYAMRAWVEDLAGGSVATWERSGGRDELENSALEVNLP